MANLSFQNAYKVPDPWDNVTELATEIIFSQDLTRLLMETYSETQLYEIDKDDIQQVLKEMTYKSCKVVLSGKNLCSQHQFTPVKEPAKDRWFKTTFMVI